MLPDINQRVWVDFVTGKTPLRPGKATINMLIHNNEVSYQRDPSPNNVKILVGRSHAFFTQFQVMFSSEIAEILK